MVFFETEKVNENITAIRSMSGEIMYLIEGTKEAVLIDTCLGVGKLREVVEGITEKPLTVLLSHGHLDHAMGAGEFETVFMNVKDQELYRRSCLPEEREGYLRAGLGAKIEMLSETDYQPLQANKEFKNLVPGMVFDLGGIHLEALGFPGHTQGTMIFLIRELRVLILGDACNNSTFLFDSDASTVQEYRQNVMGTIDTLQGKFDRIFLAHHVMETDVDILHNMVTVCDEVMAGEADDLPFTFMGMQAYIAKACNERFERNDGKSANLIYSKEKIGMEE